MPRGESQEIAHGTATDRGRTAVHHRVRRQARPVGGREGRADVPVHRLRRRDRHDRRDPLGRSGRSTSATRRCRRRMTRRRMADEREAGRDHGPTQTLDGEPQKAEGVAEGVPAEAAGEGPAASLAGRRPMPRRGRTRQGPASRARSVESQLLGTGRGGRRTKASRPTRRARRRVTVEAGRRAVPRGAGDPGPLRQEGHGAAAASRCCSPRRQDAADQGAERGGGAEVDAGAGRGVHGPVGHRLRQGRAFVEIEHRGKVVQSFWTEPGATQQSVKQAVTEAMRGGLHPARDMVRENRAYLTARQRRGALDATRS